MNGLGLFLLSVPGHALIAILRVYYFVGPALAALLHLSQVLDPHDLGHLVGGVAGGKVGLSKIDPGF